MNSSNTIQVSLPESEQELKDYITKLAANKFGYNESAAIRDCIRCHMLATCIYGYDWSQMDNPPGWAQKLIEVKNE